MFKDMRYLLSALFCLLFVASCNDDYLTRAPLDNPSDEQFLSNQIELEMAVAGIYNSLWFHPPEVGSPWILTFEHASDNSWDRNTSGLQALGRGDATPDNVFTVSFWTALYRGIGRANYVISKSPPLREEIPEEDYNRLLAEARFLRAYFYSYLIDLYGPVPLLIEQISLEDAELPRTPVEDIVDFLISELDDIVGYLPSDVNTKDRVTKGAVLALKSRVSLHHERWSESISAAEQLFQDEGYALHDHYGDLFLYAGENSEEIIMSIQYLEGQQTHPLPQNYYSRMALGHSNKKPSKSLIDSYEMVDGLPIDESPLFDPARPYDNRDPRLNHSVVLPNTEFIGYIFNTNPDSTEVWNFRTTPPTRIENTEATNAYSSFTGYLWRKYADPLDRDDRSRSELNVIMFRLAEVLLNYAEAKIEAGDIDQSVYDAINEVRGRPSVEMPAITPGKSQEELRYIVRRERKYELAGEGARYFDIRRWRIAEDVMTTLYGRIPTGFLSESPMIDEHGTPDYSNVANRDEMRIVEHRSFNPERDYLWPIPPLELETNPQLEQNPNY